MMTLRAWLVTGVLTGALAAPACSSSPAGDGAGGSGGASGSAGSDAGGGPAVDAGPDADAGGEAAPAADWTIGVDPAATKGALAPELLGHYDLSGSLFGYDKVPGLAETMKGAGFAEWRVGVGRWEIGTLLLPKLTDGWDCTGELAGFPPAAWAPPGATDLDLLKVRDWFTDDGKPVTEAATADDARYEISYVRKAIDVALAFGAKPYVDVDLMPRALSVNKTPARTKATIQDACMNSFTNAVSNARPADPAVFGAAVAGLVRRVVEGSGGEKGRPVTHWEIWNEPEFPYFWDPTFDKDLSAFVETALAALVRLDAYRKASPSPAAKALRFGWASFGEADVAAKLLEALDKTPLPGGSYAPVDFFSFHAYANDPLDVVAKIEKVAAARAASTRYKGAELVLAEWGPELDGKGWSDKGMDVPLHVATVLALGATAGLGRAHHAIFWDYFAGMAYGLVDNDGQKKPLWHAYALLHAVLGTGADRLDAAGAPGGRLEGGKGAVLAARGTDGRVRVLLVNRGDVPRTARVLVAGAPAAPAKVLVLDDPAVGPKVAAPAGVFAVPPRSLVLAEM